MPLSTGAQIRDMFTAPSSTLLSVLSIPEAIPFTGSIYLLDTPPERQRGRDLAGVVKVSSLPLKGAR